MQRNHDVRVANAADSEDRTSVTLHRSSQMLKQYVGAIGQRILSKLGFMVGLSMELRKSTSDLANMIVSLSGELSGVKAILMRLERPINDEHFVLEDITGRVFPIHLKTITSWMPLSISLQTDSEAGGAHIESKANDTPLKRGLLIARSTVQLNGNTLSCHIREFI